MAATFFVYRFHSQFRCLARKWRATVGETAAQWWERSPPTGPGPYMWVKIVVGSRLVPMVFLRVLRFPPSTKTSMSKLQFDLGTRMKTVYPRMKTSSGYVRGNSENFKWRFTSSLSFCRFPGLFHWARSLFPLKNELWNHSRTAASLANWMNRVVFFFFCSGVLSSSPSGQHGGSWWIWWISFQLCPAFQRTTCGIGGESFQLIYTVVISVRQDPKKLIYFDDPRRWL